MKTLVVTDQNHEWFQLPEATVLTARRYLTEPETGNAGTVQVLNLCRTGRYQGRGYYVSLLAEARGQRPVADVKTIENLRSESFVQALAAGLQPLVQETLQDMGYRVALNAPYAGGYTTEFYGRPAEGVHALQIEINRVLYLDERRLEPHAGFDRLRANLDRLFSRLAAADLVGQLRLA